MKTRYIVEKKDRFLIVVYTEAMGIEGCLINDIFYLREAILNWEEVALWHKEGLQMQHSEIPKLLSKKVQPRHARSLWRQLVKSCICQGFYKPVDCPTHGNKQYRFDPYRPIKGL